MQITHQLHFFDGEHHQRVILHAAHYSIGRAVKCDIRVADRFVSRHHATLVQMPQADGTFRYSIFDEMVGRKPGVHGILVNGQHVTNHLLQHLDEIVIGQTRLVYYFGDAPPHEPEDGLPVLR